MRILITVLITCLIVTSAAFADDLYMVRIDNAGDAATLRNINPDVLMSVTGGYLVLVTFDQAQTLRQSELEHTLLAYDVRRDQLALDGRFDGKNAENFEVLYQDGRVRLLLAGPDRMSLADEPVPVIPLPLFPIMIEYRPPVVSEKPTLPTSVLEDIETLMDRVEQDSLESYVLRLQDFYRRVAGTETNYAARDYIADKLMEFGCDSVSIDPLAATALPQYEPCDAYNVIAYKRGTVFPDQHIIIGGHFDAVPNSPGADDNATGTAAAMECARIFNDVDTRMSMVFVAFDAEESGLWGSYHYVDEALQRNEDIVLMINADMIAHYVNSDRADLYIGNEDAYANLWDQIGNTYVGIDADMAGSAASDHWPFQQAGFDVIFVQEKTFSSVYHSSLDSSVYLNFEYMTRMVQATAATMYTVDQSPPPIPITSIQEPGDGQSQLINWRPTNPTAISVLRLSYYNTLTPLDVTTIELAPTESSYMVEGLTEGDEYAFFVQAFDELDRTSLTCDIAYGIPNSQPQAPSRITVMPVKQAVKVTWTYDNPELDFSHCSIVRDGEIVGQTLDTFFIDDSPSLSDEMHYYYVVSADNDGNISDTVGIAPVWGKAATLQSGRIRAINRTGIHPVDFVDETETGTFMREALAGYNFEYYSDTVGTTCRVDCTKLDLIDLIDYEVIVIGAETGMWEDLAIHPMLGGILDTLAYYLSIGGKAVVFGRFGDLGVLKTIDYTASTVTYDDAYHDVFQIDTRVQTPTYWDDDSTFVNADLVSARSTVSSYPDLPWDSMATLAHAQAQAPLITDIDAVPCASFAQLTDPDADVIYTYDSRLNDPLSEGQPVAWRYFGPDYCYVFFEVPLSMFERNAAITALRQAVDEVIAGAPDEGEIPIDPPDDVLPVSFTMSQNYPNPFNPFTRIEYSLQRSARVEITIYNVLGQKVATVLDAVRPAGTHTVDWHGLDNTGKAVSTGIYLYQMKAGGEIVSRKMLLIR